MKTGKSLTELAQALTEQAQASRDFIVPTAEIASKDGELAFQGKSFGLNNWSHGQLAGYAEVPKQYADRIRSENVALYDQNINHGLAKKKDDTRMIRTVSNSTRAVLSPRYERGMSSYNILNESLLPPMLKHGFKPLSMELTDKRCYLKAINPNAKAMVAGKKVFFGMSWSNSDVGAGANNLDFFMYQSFCLNGLVFGMNSFRKVHIGRNLAGDGYQELLSNDTHALTAKAVNAQMNDVLGAVCQPDFFKSQVEKYEASAERQIENTDLKEVIELTMQKVGLTGKDNAQGILASLANPASGGNGLTQWGLANAVTYWAHKAPDISYENSDNLERAGGSILELSNSQWAKIAA